MNTVVTYNELENLKVGLEIAKEEYTKAVSRISRYYSKINILLILWSGALASLGFLISKADLSVCSYIIIPISIFALIALGTTVYAFIPVHFQYFNVSNTIRWHNLSQNEYFGNCIKEYDHCTRQIIKSNKGRTIALLIAYSAMALLYIIIFISVVLMVFGIIPMIV